MKVTDGSYLKHTIMTRKHLNYSGYTLNIYIPLSIYVVHYHINDDVILYLLSRKVLSTQPWCKLTIPNYIEASMASTTPQSPIIWSDLQNLNHWKTQNIYLYEEWDPYHVLKHERRIEGCTAILCYTNYYIFI